MLGLREATVDLVCMGSAFKGCSKVLKPWQKKTNKQPHAFLSERWPRIGYQWSRGCEGQNRSTYNWLWKALTDGLSNTLLIGTLKALSWYLASVCIFHEI